MNNKLPAFQFYPADWKKDMKVQSLTFEERGIWFEILCLMHESEQRGRLVINDVPIDEKTIARLIGCDFKLFKKAFGKIMSLGVAYRDEQGVIYNKRMVNDEKIIVIRRAAGSKGGNPILLNQMDNQKHKQNGKQNGKQNTTPAIASSFASSKKLSREQIFEFLRTSTDPQFISDRQLEKEANEFIEKYSGRNIGNLKSLVNTWASNIIPEKKAKFVQ